MSAEFSIFYEKIELYQLAYSFGIPHLMALYFEWTIKAIVSIQYGWLVFTSRFNMFIILGTIAYCN